MLLSDLHRLPLLALAVAGCSSEVERTSDWMLGTFSDTGVNYSTLELTDVAQYEFREDGTLVLSGVLGCGQNQEEVIQEYKWRRDGDSQVIVDPMAPEGGTDHWLISVGEECNTLRVDEVVDGQVFFGFTLWRGAVCMQDLPPCQGGGECASCVTVWCDEAPPACND